jgi:hypothetical protein
LTFAGTNTTLFGSRLTQVLVEVLPKSTLRIALLPGKLLGLGVVVALMGVDADTRFMGIAAAFIGVAAEGWSVIQAPSPNLTVKTNPAQSYKNGNYQKFLAASSVARNTQKIKSGDRESSIIGDSVGQYQVYLTPLSTTKPFYFIF